MRDVNVRANLLRALFKLYILFLPFGTFINIPTEGAYTVFKFFSLNISLLGCLLILLSGSKILLPKVVFLFGKQYLFMAGYSIVAAMVLTIVLTVQYEPPFKCISGDLVLYFEMLLSVVFVCYCLNKVATYKDIYRALDFQIIISLSLGLVQFMMLLGNGFATYIYDSLSSVLKLAPPEMILSMNRGVTLFGNEPSSLAIYCFLTIPYILYRTFFIPRKRILYAIGLILFILIFRASLSTQTFVLFIIEVLVFFLLVIARSHIYSALLKLSFLLGLLMAILLSVSDDISSSGNDESDGLQYVLVGKAFDRDNYSTQMRFSCLINDMKVFSNFYGIGVGSGCQGYWYEDNIPLWVSSSPEVQDLLQRKVVPNGGGCFFPDYLSAYGFLGIIVLLFFVHNYSRLLNNSDLKTDRMMHVIFQTSLVIMIFAFWFTVNPRETPIAFLILAIPFTKQTNKV